MNKLDKRPSRCRDCGQLTTVALYCLTCIRRFRERQRPSPDAGDDDRDGGLGSGRWLMGDVP